MGWRSTTFLLVRGIPPNTPKSKSKSKSQSQWFSSPGRSPFSEKEGTWTHPPVCSWSFWRAYSTLKASNQGGRCLGTPTLPFYSLRACKAPRNRSYGTGLLSERADVPDSTCRVRCSSLLNNDRREALASNLSTWFQWLIGDIRGEISKKDRKLIKNLYKSRFYACQCLRVDVKQHFTSM